MEVWPFIQQKLNASQEVMLLWVVESKGSSPGRQGFKMAVCADESFIGTIGGGIMEHKLVEKAKSLLLSGNKIIFLANQFHDKQHDKDRSGMICSGSQTIAFVPLSNKDLSLLQTILSLKDDRDAMLRISPAGLCFVHAKEPGFTYHSEEDWLYCEAVHQQPVIHIIGGGHVCLALSELMAYLGFYIKIYDNRAGLNTVEDNRFAHEKHTVDYENIATVMASCKDDYVVIVTHGYRDDKTVFKQLLNKEFFYLGMMGSKAKIATMLRELELEGINPDCWGHCFLPIGINIFSKTAKEIAVSIAAEIIRERNKGLAGAVESLKL